MRKKEKKNKKRREESYVRKERVGEEETVGGRVRERERRRI